ncbi:alpha/beta fold hydrolase [Mycolicibacterium sp. 120266]|uniref:alpha/beta hydrolase n=1 Tax=Mycolicibacterium sp. 120266 TaxID=3090601 RepID=UPI00299F3927|nr:alpha/beta fold hydrolase [Mycolicibacterium sp. 120266]MDX1876124.1 alpha/beta fold hydrolase [Mycolicibacterium sp. 120266]
MTGPNGTERLDVEFTSAGVTCRGWLYLPDTPAPAPIIVMAHGFGGIKEMRLDAYAERFRAAGYACLVFDYRHFGASDGEPRQLLDVERQLADWAAAIAFARSRRDVDSYRIILWGSSFSGGHVLSAAARDSNVAAVISQCPFTDGLVSVLAMDRLSGLRVGMRAVADIAAHVAGRPPVMLPIVGAPGSVAMMTAPDAAPAMVRMVPPGVEWRNEVAARVALQVIRYRPGRDAANVHCPLLACVCSADSVAPADASLQHLEKAPEGDIRLYSQGHFDIYDGAAFEQLISDQIGFLTQHVPLVGSSTPHRRSTQKSR